ncbi:glucose PTS transporter subunit IIA [Lactiplantibacillus fabifermentans]|uniref:Beta-glucoside-specific phosphotransferase system (PTS), IIABC component n=2 Tax=Lactiplantibacillus fabifermentans TaxID=483011 RepID=A0A0R2NCV4_9LACO|nr:glucose PTS transporter subunit IIA [Lactiplantibacillus fabifermentans]ETY74228.1 PTS beta-glucoside transporter subunit IIABC [Lactiplantibacillus fabifermentans T30PCM01]KRO23704.1 Beta-glucoside-specific phosphotransferase system (PTS), IIABC component [Lactiplantibacillus fabifermentans DSM 21115]
MDYHKLAADIVKNVGGVDNIEVVNHCMTRLRFNLKEVNRANKESLEALDGVLGVVYAGEQYMVILGQNLIPTYEAVIKDFDIQAGASVDENLDDLSKQYEPLTWKNVGTKFIGFISASVTPLIPGLIAGGMLKVVLLLIVSFVDAAYAKTPSYLLLSAIADAPFYFMPIIVAYGAATKLGGTPVYAMVATAALLHGNYTTMVTAATKGVTLFGFNVKLLSYGTTLLPALLVAIVAYYAEKYLNKIVPGIFRSVFVGMGTIFIAGSLGYLILGPLGNMLGQYIASFFMFLNSTVGPLAVGLLAAALPWMVMAGMHTALAPFMTQLLSNPGYDAILRPAFILHNMSEGGANLGVAARTKNSQFRSECVSLAIGCIVAGVTEPAIYGVNLKYRKPMYGVMAGGFAGGVIASLLGAKAYVMGYSNLLALPIFQQTVLAMVIAIVVAIATSAIVTFILGIDEQPAPKVTEPVQKTYPDDAITAVSDGELIDLAAVHDETFASKVLGDGVALKLTSDFICAPANGTLATMFPTGHAFGVVTNTGVELLVHIGIDTVNLQGDGFDVLVHQDEVVRAGQPIVRVDRDKLEKAGYDLTTMLIVTNANNQTIQLQTSGVVKVGTQLN